MSKEEVDPDDVRALYRRIERPLRESLSAAHFKETEKTRNKEGWVEVGRAVTSFDFFLSAPCHFSPLSSYAHRRIHVELPFHSKFLLISAYIASYNPVCSS